MLDSHLTKILGGCFLSMLASSGICADGPLAVPQAQTTQAAPSPAALAYQTQMLALSNAIAAKIAQVQSVQKQIDTEIYPTSLPPLQAQKAQLQKELDVLNLNQQQLLAQKTAADMTTSLQQTKP